MTQRHWSAASRLLDRDLPEGYLKERTAIIAAQRRTDVPGAKSVVIFRIGAECLALPTNLFQEVAQPARVHKIPHRLDGVLGGLVNVRGELLVCVTLEALLGLQKSSQATTGRLLVCNREGNRLAFSVSEVYGVHHYHPHDLMDVPSTLAKAAATYTLGILHWKDRTVGCLDDELLFYALNKGLA